jgi:uncharacterized protein (TIGR03435 family)
MIGSRVTLRHLLLLSPAVMAISIIAAQSHDAADWQAAAGGRMAFEVASVKPSMRVKMPNFPLDNNDAKTRGGRFSASFPLSVYISFAYKLAPAENRSLDAQLPKSVGAGFYEIEAQSTGNPTKDQMRLMMQALLADRFKLAVHFERREAAVSALTLVNPGKTGPKLRPHAEGPACSEFTVAFVPPNANTRGVFPPVCETTQTRRTDNGRLIGSRNATMAQLADAIYIFGSIAEEVDKPVVDRTGLDGRFDFILDVGGFRMGPSDQDSSFISAMRQQLGLKLVSTKGAIRPLVIDHVERPSEN